MYRKTHLSNCVWSDTFQNIHVSPTAIKPIQTDTPAVTPTANTAGVKKLDFNTFLLNY